MRLLRTALFLSMLAAACRAGEAVRDDMPPPREHREERNMLHLEHERQQLQVRLAEVERQAQADSAGLARFNLVSVIAIGVFGLAIAGIALAGTLYQTETRLFLETVVDYMLQSRAP